ncbi:T9SS C-terminal target domain-containing protein [Arenibacter aquaticus]|uniref:T9SS C-terminal target domain-containing protein n=1 Tax=Arenibacter aquaticus TaxID=2489054 RepID=A0A3S0IN34_9FLAO|nr:tyrosinase family protein [Arenibacter aquaticus]RTE53812.1 T9SS C-terminal target domain-containing protein [Arenibacter aquaticus]
MKHIYRILIFLCFANSLVAQSIRKNYQEMTDYEKTELVDAFYELRNGPDLFNDLANFHSDFFNFDNTTDETRLDLHFNLPDEPEREIFLAWHRRQMFEMEQAVQDINPDISLAWWDTSIDQSTTSPLWDQDFLGSFNANWNLNRNLGGNGPLPTPQDVTNLYAMTDFFEFSNELERRPVHRGAHVWTGGAMPTPLSPRDPIFYFHHSFVDWVWHNWEEIHQSSSFLTTSMLRYDGTYVYDGQTLPLVNPNDITDSRSLGVFFGVNGLAELDNYIVSNTYRPEEVFYYQFVIEAGDNFIVPNGSSCRMESVNEVRLLPGFEAAAGSNFIAAIDQENGLTGKTFYGEKPRLNKPYDFDANINKPIVWEEDNKDDTPVIIQPYPNPFTEKITINLNKKTNCSVEVYNMMGMLIRQEAFQNTDNIIINNLYGLSSGFYVIKVVDANGDILMAKRVVKL